MPVKESNELRNIKNYDFFMIKIKRIYEEASADDGYRILVDRLWPRGISKERAKLDLWLKEIAPSTELRTWFAHDPGKWTEFRKKYLKELQSNPALDELLTILKKEHDLTLLYGAKNTELNEARVIKDLIENK